MNWFRSEMLKDRYAEYKCEVGEKLINIPNSSDAQMSIFFMFTDSCGSGTM
ncbi:hypothetical protein ACP8HI_01820 [Paenibacillus sp. FA6]|uniref:hypothetical protein n=1 Tax=Paenibacillus sp. FA6 TaxID=3413029 RepID=UPI003F65897F